jgi:phosphatidylinositol-3-phosphatase
MRQLADGELMSSLRSLRLTRRQIALVAGLSGIATGLIIASALGHTPAQSAVMAALKHPPTEVRLGPGAARAAEGSGGSSGGGAGNLAPPASPPASPAASTPSSSSDGDSGSSGTDSSDSDTTETTTTTSSSTTTAATHKHNVKHVFVIGLSTTSYEAAFGAHSVARYLNRKLRPKGTLLGGYESLGSAELPDYLAMISGQAPNADTTAGCSTYAEFPTGTKPNAKGVVPGDGCVYPNTITTIGDQVTADGHSWKAFIQDQGKTGCVHPNSGALDDAPLPGAGADYDTRHNPFIYFHSLLDLGGCSENDVALTQLPAALRLAAKAPAYSFIAPGACEDASVTSCESGGPAGLAAEDAFLKSWVPRIMRSPAYKDGGALIIAFALAGAPTAGGPAPTGALVLSHYASAGKTISTTYNAYSVLRSTEDLLGFSPLAHASSARSFVASALPGAIT